MIRRRGRPYVHPTLAIALGALGFLAIRPSPVSAYSVLAHESLIDAAWATAIEPILRQHFPRASADDLIVARTYAYGGSAVQDMGYYPFGSRFLSNLLHYVRSGDFIEILLRDARGINEEAFALGALAHYVGDNTGHPEAINRLVPMLFPKLGRKYGARVLYDQAPAEHVITEFSLDVVQTAAGRYGPEAYTRFIGFEVATPLVERAIRDTYGIEAKELFGDLDMAVGTYRFSVSQMIPALTKAAWRDKHDAIARLIPNVDERAFVYSFSRVEYEGKYGRTYKKPGWIARCLGFLYRLVPKIGPLKPLAFTTPTPQADTLFRASLATARTRFRAALEEVRVGTLELRNADFDTGASPHFGEYRLADETYATLVHRLKEAGFARLPAAVRENILQYYANPSSPSEWATRKRTDWRRLQQELALLKSTRPSP